MESELSSRSIGRSTGGAKVPSPAAGEHAQLVERCDRDIHVAVAIDVAKRELIDEDRGGQVRGGAERTVSVAELYAQRLARIEAVDEIEATVPIQIGSGDALDRLRRDQVEAALEGERAETQIGGDTAVIEGQDLRQGVAGLVEQRDSRRLGAVDR